MAIAERVLDRTHQAGAAKSREIPVNSGVVAAFYDAKFILGIATPEDVDAKSNLIPPVVRFSINGPDNTRYRTGEGPNVAGMIQALDLKQAELEKSMVELTRRKARKVREELEDIERVRTTLDENSTRPIDSDSTPEEVAQSIWGVGNRSQVPGYMAYRIEHDANRIVHIHKLTHNQYGPAFKKAAEALGGRRELIVSEDRRFYQVTRYEATSDEMAVVPLQGFGVESLGNAANSEESTYFQQDYQEPPEKEPVLEATVIAGSAPKVVRPTRKWILNKPVIAAITTSVLATPLVGAAGISYLRNRSAVITTVDMPTELSLPTTVPAPVEQPTTSTTLEQKPTTTTSTTLPPVEVSKPVDPIGVEWLPDTMNPWKELIAKESAIYGIDAALPAVYAFIKTAGDYTFLTNDGEKAYGGLFGLREDVLQEGARALNIANPLLVDAKTNIKVGVRLIAIKFKESGGSVRKTGIALEGADGEVARWLEGMMNDRGKQVSSHFEEYIGKYGYRIPAAREKLKGIL